MDGDIRDRAEGIKDAIRNLARLIKSKNTGEL